MPKQRPGKKGKSQRRNNDPLVKKPRALGDEENSNYLGGGIRFREEESNEAPTAQLVEPKSTWKILQQARQQQQEENPATDYEENFPALTAFTGKKIFLRTF